MSNLVRHKKYYPTAFWIYGPGGTLKSTFAASFPKPACVIFTDSFAKAMPYLSKGVYTEYEESAEGILQRQVFSKKEESKKLFHIYYVHDIEAENPEGFDMFEHLIDTIDYEQYKTIIVDTYTSLEYMARNKAETLPHKEEDGWFVPKTVRRFVEPYFRSKFLKIKINLVVLGHITRERVKSDGADTMLSYLYSPAAVGQMKEDILRVFPETYCTKVVKDGAGKKILLQTEINNKYGASTQINAPDDLELTRSTTYKDLWVNFSDE